MEAKTSERDEIAKMKKYALLFANESKAAKMAIDEPDNIILIYQKLLSEAAVNLSRLVSIPESQRQTEAAMRARLLQKRLHEFMSIVRKIVDLRHVRDMRNIHEQQKDLQNILKSFSKK